ncbi:alpha/beta hydrolase [Nocardioides sp.]|uniref:alpha/beta hydrolase n=1 Tax=Nocardioides sp. TaxID=35761 RepID=UPI002621E3EE|nr:alpha/beta hydrolase [Nocardioides sp.]
MLPLAPHTLRQLALGTVTGIVLRPLDGPRTAIGSFAIGWLAGDFAPQLLAASLTDTALAVRRHRATPLGLALTAATTVGLGVAIGSAWRSRITLAEAAHTSPLPRPPLRRLLRPLHFRDTAVRVDRNLPYGPYGGRNRLDLYRPADRDGDGAPVLVQIHGGGWTIGSKEQQGRLLMNAMAAQGWVCVAINYRLAPRSRWPAHLDDVRAALGWVQREIRSYGGDPGHVVLTGGSAGGHLAALAALTAAPGSIAACVPFYGVYDLLGEDQDVFTLGMRESLLAPRIFAPDAVDEDYRVASPLHQVHPDAPDFLVLHGRLDTLVSVRQARAFVARLRAVSRGRVDYAELALTQHAFDVVGSVRAHHAVAAVSRWLVRHHAERTSPSLP